MAVYTLNGSESLGIEFGSTRIKAVLIDENFNPIATGSHNWENKLIDGIWTYSLDDVWSGLQDAYANLNSDVYKKFGVKITRLNSIGFSAMMHGYLPFDSSGNPLTEFRTWRNTMTSDASKELTALFKFNIPQRWSIAHLYQAVINNEPHINSISFLTTLAGYVHWHLSGEKVLGIGEASGMFPINSEANNYDAEMMKAFDILLAERNIPWKLNEILPKVLPAGEKAGFLTQEGARLIDPTGTLKPGAVLCPPEGDAGTGMVATNSVRVKTGNVSAGTSIFSMIVLDKLLSKVYEEIDMVTTPTGKPVAMVHCNNCCTDLDCWISLFIQFSDMAGVKLKKSQIYDMLYHAALEGDKSCGGIVSFNYFSGEPVTKLSGGRPLLVRNEKCNFNLSNFIRAQIYSAMASLKIGMDILKNEKVDIDTLMGHGGLFKTKYVGQKLMAGAMDTPVAVMETAGEGGAWGAAILAKYTADAVNQPLEDYLDERVFSKYKSTVEEPDRDDVRGFEEYMQLYKKAIAVEETAVKTI